MTIFFGIILTIAALVIIFWPLFKNSGYDEAEEMSGDTTANNLLLDRDRVFSTISELDSDYAIGNLSQRDYTELRRRYEEKAISIIKELDEWQAHLESTGLNVEDEIENEVLKIRSSQIASIDLTCATCGARLRPADNFCPRCGSPSSLICPNCTARCSPTDHFCARCGTPLGQNKPAA